MAVVFRVPRDIRRFPGSFLKKLRNDFDRLHPRAPATRPYLVVGVIRLGKLSRGRKHFFPLSVDVDFR